MRFPAQLVGAVSASLTTLGGDPPKIPFAGKDSSSLALSRALSRPCRLIVYWHTGRRERTPVNRETRTLCPGMLKSAQASAAVASGTGSPWPEVARALSTQTEVAPNATTKQP